MRHNAHIFGKRSLQNDLPLIYWTAASLLKEPPVFLFHQHLHHGDEKDDGGLDTADRNFGIRQANQGFKVSPPLAVSREPRLSPSSRRPAY
jgi:hypothetical protein